jgi:hypothetical protein
VPPRLLRAIDTLRKLLPRATDFAELYEHFDDHLVRTPELWASSEPREDDFLFALAVAIATRFRPGFQPLSWSLYEVGDTGFWHGAVKGTNAMACLFYDERAGLGLVVLNNPFDGTCETHFVRFTRVMPARAGAAEQASERLMC